MNYDFLVSHINKLDSDEKKLKFISTFILKNVKYNYEYLDNSKISKYLRDNAPDSLVDFDKPVEAVKFIEGLALDLSLTESYKRKMLNLYQWNYRNECYIEFINLVPRIACFRSEDGILKTGVCQQISEFFNKLCNEVGIQSRCVRGNTGFAHQWNVVNVKGQDLHYDLTYAMYSKDGYSDWDKKTSPKDWLGVTGDRLKQLHPQRRIDDVM